MEKNKFDKKKKREYFIPAVLFWISKTTYMSTNSLDLDKNVWILLTLSDEFSQKFKQHLFVPEDSVDMVIIASGNG